MEGKLTAQLLAAYLPCKLKYVPDGEIFNIVGLSFDEDNFQVEMEQYYDWWNITDDYKIVLRHLSEATDAEAIEVVKMLDWTLPMPDDEKLCMIGKGVILGFMTDQNSMHFSTAVTVINYLRKQGIDCDNLLATGQAVKS